MIEYLYKNIPLWELTIWDKKFNGVDKQWQKDTIKYKYLFSDEIEKIKRDTGDVTILYTGKDSGLTTEDLAGEYLAKGEVVSIPWGGIPSVKYCKGKFVTADNRIATSSNVTKLSNKYLYYFMIGNLKTIASFYRGASMKHPSMKDVLNMKIDLPSLNQQNSITDNLDKITEIIQKKEHQLTYFDELIKSRFVEMFGNPEKNDLNWDNKPLSELMILANNGMARRGNDANGEIVLRLVELQDGYINYASPNRIILNENEKKRYKLIENDFLFARVNGNPLNVGRCAVYKDIGEPVYHNDHIIRVRFDDNILNGCFASELFNSDYGKKQMSNQIKTSAGQYTINQNGIGAIIVILPPIELQNEFANFVEQVNKSKFV